MEYPDRDPFDPVFASTRTVTLVGPLAQRDPRARPDDTLELPITGEVSFDDVLRRARRRGFLAGLAAGALAAAAVAAAMAATRSSPPRRQAIASAPEPAAVAPTAPADVIVATPAPARPEPRRAAVAAPPRAGAEAVIAPGLDLRRAPPEETDPAATRADAARADAPAGDAPAPGPAPAAPPAPAAAPAADATRPPRRLEHAEVAAAVAARRDAIDACVAATSADAAASGGRRFLLVLSVDPSGRVTEVRIDDPVLADSALGRCLARVASEVSFEPFDGEPVEIELPLRNAAR